MVHWYESAVDRQLREAQERGEFENLPGAGKPLRGAGGEYDEDWWVKDWVRREGAGSGVLPPTLALRREREDLDREIDRRPSEQAVRDYVAALNEQIRKARVGLLDGPPTLLPPIDVEKAVAGWRERKGLTGPR
jgi:DnaJ-like protein